MCVCVSVYHSKRIRNKLPSSTRFLRVALPNRDLKIHASLGQKG